MIMLTKEQLADLLREAHLRGYAAGQSISAPMTHTEAFHDLRERAIQPLVHRSSGGHDDHGREVRPAEKFRERSNHHVVRGHESQPCWCWADSDHRIGEEVRQKDAQGGDKP